MLNLLTTDYADIIRIAEQHGFSSKSEDPGVVLDEASDHLYRLGLGFYPKINAPRDVLRKLQLLVFLFLLTACSTHQVSMKYQPTGQVVGKAPGQASVSVGKFTDERGEEANYLGAIRGAAYNPGKILRTPSPLSETVEASFADALRIRNMLGGMDATVLIEGKISKFNLDFYNPPLVGVGRRTSNAALRVTVVLLPSRALIFSNVYATENGEWGWPGLTGDNTDPLDLIAQKTLNETIDKALSDPGLLAAIASAELVVTRKGE